MKERPIIFTGPNVLAILEDRKTQTRRVIKPQPELNERGTHWSWSGNGWPKKEGSTSFGWPDQDGFPVNHPILNGVYRFCPYGVAGDRLWVRETCWIDREPVPQLGHRRVFFDDSRLVIHETGERGESPHPPSAFVGFTKSIKRCPSIHMPRWASRITLEITKVRVERLQDISEKDAEAEGARNKHDVFHSAIQASIENSRSRNFATSWDKINAKRGHGWATNPWCWCISFRKL